MDITRWPTLKSYWLYSLQPKMEKLYTLSKNKTGADCGSDGKEYACNAGDLSSIPGSGTLFQQHKRRLYTWRCPDSQHWNHIDYILCSQRWRPSIQSAKTRPGADRCSDHELLIAKFRLKLNKVEKTITPFRYDLNQNPSDYTVDMKHRLRD